MSLIVFFREFCKLRWCDVDAVFSPAILPVGVPETGSERDNKSVLSI